MRELMRSRVIYEMVHSTDPDAVDKILAAWEKQYLRGQEPGAEIPDELRERTRDEISQAVGAVAESSGWFSIAPSGLVEVRDPAEVAAEWEDVNSDVLGEIFEVHQALIQQGAQVNPQDVEAIKAQGRQAIIEHIAGMLSVVDAIDAEERLKKKDAEELERELGDTEVFNTDPYSEPS